MLWPLLFTRFLLASTARTSDNATTASATPYGDVSPALKQVLCRMLGEPDGQSDAECEQWAEEGCGCPIEEPSFVEPVPLNTINVGWEKFNAANKAATAITFSFEKEWLGDAPDLHKWFGPGGEACETLWPSLQETDKQLFMQKFRAVDAGKHPSLDKYKEYQYESECGLRMHDKHMNLPLKRTEGAGGDAAPASIFPWIEFDSGPWEMKAASFFYDLDEMERVVKRALPYVDVPGFPAERRIQVHVVAPLTDKAYNENNLRKNFRLIQLYFSDYMLLRLFFPHGPGGGKCSGDYGEFSCDVFNDFYNSPIETTDGYEAYLTSPFSNRKPLHHKYEIVGLRGSDNEYQGTQAEMDTIGVLNRVGLEIRKSESFDHAVLTARAIAESIATMQTDGAASVHIDREPIDIGTVGGFAETHRAREESCTLPVTLADEPTNTYTLTVASLAMYLHMTIGMREIEIKWDEADPPKKLLHMLRVLLCSDWTQLLGEQVAPGRTTHSRDNILKALDALGEQVTAAFHEKHAESYPEGTPYKQLRHAVWNDFKEQEGGVPENVGEAMDEFRRMVAQYAYELSEHF